MTTSSRLKIFLHSCWPLLWLCPFFFQLIFKHLEALLWNDLCMKGFENLPVGDILYWGSVDMTYHRIEHDSKIFLESKVIIKFSDCLLSAQLHKVDDWETRAFCIEGFRPGCVSSAQDSYVPVSQQCMRTPFSPHPHQHLLYPVFWW